MKHVASMFLWNVGLLSTDYRCYIREDRILHWNPRFKCLSKYGSSLCCVIPRMQTRCTDDQSKVSSTFLNILNQSRTWSVTDEEADYWLQCPCSLLAGTEVSDLNPARHMNVCLLFLCCIVLVLRNANLLSKGTYHTFIGFTTSEINSWRKCYSCQTRGSQRGDVTTCTLV
jgi:hypothetical protein